MRSGLFSVLTVCIIMLLIASSCQKKVSQVNKVIIAGKILNYNPSDGHETLELHFRDLMRSNENILVIINEDGSFKTKAECFYPQDFYIIYGRLGTLFCSPGDSLFVEIDADIWEDKNNKFPNDEHFVRVPGGTAVEVNKHVIEFTNLRSSRYNWTEEKKIITESTPLVYKEHVYDFEQMLLVLLDSFNQVHNTSKTFDNWVQDYIQYGTLKQLMRYRWTHPRYNNFPRDSFDIPESYFSFFLEYDMDDSDMISINHNDFLHEYSMYVWLELIPSDSSKMAMQLYKAGDTTASNRIRLNNIKLHTSGYTRDVFIAKFYSNLLGWKMFKEFEALYDPELIQKPYLKTRIANDYERLKSFYENPQFITGTNLQEIGEDIVSPILDSISSRYRGKVLYIDFWAPWCAPCMGEMPDSKELQKEYENQDVVFIFLAARCTVKSWKGTIAEKQMTGEHFHLSDDQYNVLRYRFGITGIPHYVLADKSGKIIFEDAPRPSRKAEIMLEIDRLLSLR